MLKAARMKADQEAAKKRENEMQETNIQKRKRQHLEHASRVRSYIDTKALKTYYEYTEAEMSS